MNVSAEIWGTYDAEYMNSNICRSVTCSKPAVLSMPIKVKVLEDGVHARLYLCAECGRKVFDELFPLPEVKKVEGEIVAEIRSNLTAGLGTISGPEGGWNIAR